MWNTFDERTQEYDSWYDRHPDIYLKELDLLRIESAGPKLEIGVGTGRIGGRLGYDVGLDPSLNSLVMAQSRGINAVLGVGERLPFGDNTLGTVLICMSLWLFDDRSKVLEDVGRVLAPDGTLILAVIFAESPLGIEYAQRRENEPGSFYADCWLLSRDVLLGLIGKNGFDVISETPAGLETPDVVCLVCRRTDG